MPSGCSLQCQSNKTWVQRRRSPVSIPVAVVERGCVPLALFCVPCCYYRKYQVSFLSSYWLFKFPTAIFFLTRLQFVLVMVEKYSLFRAHYSFRLFFSPKFSVRLFWWEKVVLRSFIDWLYSSMNFNCLLSHGPIFQNAKFV